MALSTKHSVLKLCTFFCLAGIVSLLISGCSKKEEEVPEEVIRPAKIMEIQKNTTIQEITYPGKVRALDRVEVSFEVSGRLIELPIKEGQLINKGDVIARIDASDYQSRLDAAQARVNQTKAEVDRYANLLKEKVVAKSTYDVKLKNYDISVSDMKIAKKAVSDTFLRAPFSGLIGKRFIDNFQVVQVKEPIVSIQKTTAVDIIVNAPELYIGQKDRYNIKLFAEFANYPGERYPVTVKEFSTEADSQTQTYRIVFTMPIPAGKAILDGMTVSVHMIRQHKEGAVVSGVKIPIQSVFYDETKKAYVWIVNPDMTISKRAVTVGMMEKGNITVTKGLAAGEKIITAGVQKLTPGAKVREFTGTLGE
jgi:RND family efflux transporter MFP subunit